MNSRDANTLYEFQSGLWHAASDGSPILEDASANFICQLSNSYDAGTHRIVLGLVQDVLHTGNLPLAYAKRAYHEPKLIESSFSEGKIK